MNVNYLGGITAVFAGLLMVASSIALNYLQNCSISNPCPVGSSVIMDLNYVAGSVIFSLGLWQIGHEHNRRKSSEIEQPTKNEISR